MDETINIPFFAKGKRKKRKRWKMFKLEADRAACRYANVVITDCLRTYFRDKISDVAPTARQRWDTVKRLLHTSSTGESQSDGDSKTLCERYAFFLSEDN